MSDGRLTSTCPKHQEIEDKLEKILQILEAPRGMSWRVEKMSAAFYPGPDDSAAEKGGFLVRLKRSENSIDRLWKLFWAMAGGCGVAVLGLLVTLLTA